MAVETDVELAKRDAEALYELALSHYHGDGAAQDFEEAFRLMLLAAETGYASAQNSLAIMHETGCGTATNLEKAVEFYLKAAGQGEARAQGNEEALEMLDEMEM